MAKDYGAREKGDVHRFLPEDLTLVTDKLSPLYDPRVAWEGDPELAEEIAQMGQLVPVIVRQNGRHDGTTGPEGKPRMEVVDGRRRVKAIAILVARARANGVAEEDLPLVECTVKRQTNNDHTAMAALVSANEHRKATPPSMRAEQAARMEDKGMTHAAIAASMRMSTKEVAQLIALASLDTRSKAAIDANVLPLRQASSLARLSSEERAPLIAAAEASPRGQAIARKQVADVARTRADKDRPAPVRTHRTKREIEAHLGDVTAQLESAKARVSAARGKVGTVSPDLSLDVVALTGVVAGLEWALGLRATSKVKT